MCSKEEVLAIVSESEERILKKVHEEIRCIRDESKEVMTQTEKSHMAVAGTISDFGDMLNKNILKIEGFLEKYGTRISDLEIWRAVHSNESEMLKQKIDKIDSNMSRVVWLVLTGVIVAILGLVLK